MPEDIIIDGLEEHAFRRSIEIMLRNGRADEAELRLKALLPEVAGPGKVLPERLLEIRPSDIRLGGWDKLAGKIEEYSRPSIPITAIGIGIGDPSDSGLTPDAEGNLRPPLETTFYSDATFPFSETDRADLLEGYSAFGCEWQGDHDKIDDTLSIEGIDDLYGAIARLENEVGASDKPSASLIRAGAIGACYLGVLVWQASRKVAIEQGLPRPLAILLVNSDAYPFFDLPVMTCEEYLDDGVLQIVEHVSAAAVGTAEHLDQEEPEEFGSLTELTGLGAHREKSKKMALVLAGAEAENPLGMADDLVARAAFDPSSVDISRFMPDASQFRNEPEPEPEQEEEPEPEPEFEPEAASEPDLASKPDLAFDWPHAELSQRPEGEPQAEAEAEPDTAFANPYAQPPVPDEAVAADGVDEADAWTEQSPEAPSANPDPVVHDEIAATPAPSDVTMPWHGQDADLPFTPQPAATGLRERPSGHALRDRIRSNSVPQVVEPVSTGLFAAIARIFKSIKDMLLRR